MSFFANFICPFSLYIVPNDLIKIWTARFAIHLPIIKSIPPDILFKLKYGAQIKHYKRLKRLKRKEESRLKALLDNGERRTALVPYKKNTCAMENKYAAMFNLLCGHIRRPWSLYDPILDYTPPISSIFEPSESLVWLVCMWHALCTFPCLNYDWNWKSGSSMWDTFEK